MPKYKCHKEVWALKIKDLVVHDNETATITPAEEGYVTFTVSREFMQKNDVQPGGYYVVYKDGYASYSPAVAFEEGYELIV